MNVSVSRCKQTKGSFVMPLKIHTREKKPMFFEIGLEGRLDMTTYEQLQSSIDFIFGSPVKAIQFDMAELEYINSMGLRVIFMAAKKAKAQGATFLVTRPQPQIRAILDIANALPSQSVFSSIEEADRYFDAIQKKSLGKTEE